MKPHLENEGREHNPITQQSQVGEKDHGPNLSPEELCGVSNAEQLPVAESWENIPPSSLPVAESLVPFLGEYKVRCLYSRNWMLREAVVMKLASDTGKFIDAYASVVHHKSLPGSQTSPGGRSPSPSSKNTVGGVGSSRDSLYHCCQCLERSVRRTPSFPQYSSHHLHSSPLSFCQNLLSWLLLLFPLPSSLSLLHEPY